MSNLEDKIKGIANALVNTNKTVDNLEKRVFLIESLQNQANDDSFSLWGPDGRVAQAIKILREDKESEKVWIKLDKDLEEVAKITGRQSNPCLSQSRETDFEGIIKSSEEIAKKYR